MKKISGLPMVYDFDYVVCPKCKMYCAIIFKTGAKTGMVECRSSDFIKPCNYFGDKNGKAEKREDCASRSYFTI